jgi:hypothetical protein
MVVPQIGLHFCAVISEASRVICFHIFTLVAAVQNEEDFKLGLVRVPVYKRSSVHCLFSNTRRMTLSVGVKLFDSGKSEIKISQLLFSLIFSLVFFSSFR